MPFSYRDKTKELNALARKGASGSFVQLSDGFTHYELSNPHARDAERVVLVHGFSVPYFIFDPTSAFLTQSGFRVLRYDLLGRGFSDRPATLQLAQPVSLVGVSTGGPITAAFTAHSPDRVDRLVLIDRDGAK